MRSLLFAVLGAAGSGRAALISSWVEESSRVLVHVDEREYAIEAGIPAGQIVPWKWVNDRIGIGGEIPVGAELFFLSNGRESPVDFLEGLEHWLRGKPVDLGRILTVMNCSLLAANEKLKSWYDACIHFSDAVLLGSRHDVTNLWIKNLQKSHKDRSYPCHFRFIKKNRIDNPGEILYPEARRISLVFEDEEDRYDEEGNYMEEEYFQRDEAGRRVKWVPDIVNFLP